MWTTLPEASQSCYELIHCGFKKGCTKRCRRLLTWWVKALLTHARPSIPIQTFQTHSRLPKSVPGPPHKPKILHIHPNPSPHIQYPQLPHKLSMPIPGPPLTPKAPYTHLRPSTPKHSPSHPYQALNTHLRPSTPIQCPSHPPQVLRAHPWPHKLSLGLLYLP